MAKVELTLEEKFAALQQKAGEQDAQLKANAQTIKDQVGQLQTQGQQLADQAKELSQVKSEVGQKAERVRQLELEAEASEQTLNGYQEKLRVADAAGDGSVVVSHNEQLYRVVIPHFHFEGTKVSAESLKTDATLVAKLVEVGSGVLEPVVT